MGWIDDRRVAELLLSAALAEIRLAAFQASQRPDERAPGQALEHIRFLADLVHNLPHVVRAPARLPRRARPLSRRERALEERPMSWTWNTCGPEGQAWITDQVEKSGHRWMPPAALPEPRRGVPRLSSRQRISSLVGWPVKVPAGCEPLPRQAFVLKALNADGIVALHREAGELRLGLGSDSSWLRAHLDATAVHFLFPDPAEYYWPSEDGPISWWQCRALLVMSDGEQVSSSLAVLPETFLALPSTVPRRLQRRLVVTTRLLGRDLVLWGRDHQADCSSEGCGYAQL
ncbi:hypothetical protein AB0L70_28155 [Kribbella sp. NPDC051952]|uniref:hypothetical protein n=1 Tax=Kribbella sp. NPDC051952 TaxID=3154851 RepID=UPI00341AA568